MAFTIGLRFYRLSLYREGDQTPLNSEDFPGSTDFLELFKQFCAERSNPTDEGEAQRSWYIQVKDGQSIRSVHGLISYGTHGFQSKLVDNKTKAENYLRKTTDLEEIPLYFQFWVPSNSKYAYAVLQSFQGRSCVKFILDALREKVSTSYKGYRLLCTKIMPTDGERFLSAPVKSVTLRRSTIPADRFESYLNGIPTEEAEYEIKFKAKRKSVLGVFGDFKPAKENQRDIVMHDGVEFDEVKAEVVLGKKRRTVGLMGPSNNSGVIEVSDDVKRGQDGHPTFESIAKEVEILLADITGMTKT